MIHISQVVNKTETITYWRNPTKSEIKFGHGATHYRDFEFIKCFDANGNLKLKVRASDDKLIYYCTDIECSTSRSTKIDNIQCE